MIESIKLEMENIEIGDYIIITRKNRTKWYTCVESITKDLFDKIDISNGALYNLAVRLSLSVRYNEKMTTPLIMFVPHDEILDITDGLKKNSYYINPKYSCEPFNIIIKNNKRVTIVAKVLHKLFYISEDLKTELADEDYIIDNTDYNINLIDNL